MGTPPGIAAAYFYPHILYGQRPSEHLMSIAQRAPESMHPYLQSCHTAKHHLAMLLERFEKRTGILLNEETVVDVLSAYVIHETLLAPIRLPIYAGIAYGFTRAYSRNRALLLLTYSNKHS